MNGEEELLLEFMVRIKCKEGYYADEFEERYCRIVEEIHIIKEEQAEARRKRHLTDNYEQRLKDMNGYFQQQTCQMMEFDKNLARRLISNIKIASAERWLIQFQSESSWNRKLDTSKEWAG